MKLPGDNLTDAQVEQARQQLIRWWPKEPGPVRVLCRSIGISKGALIMFRQNRYWGNNRMIAKHLADYFGIEL